MYKHKIEWTSLKPVPLIHREFIHNLIKDEDVEEVCFEKENICDTTFCKTNPLRDMLEEEDHLKKEETTNSEKINNESMSWYTPSWDEDFRD